MHREIADKEVEIFKRIITLFYSCPVCLKLRLEPQIGKCNHSICAQCWGASGKVCKVCGEISGGRNLLPDTKRAKSLADFLAIVEDFKIMTKIDVLPRLSVNSRDGESDKDSRECFIDRDMKYSNMATYKKKKSSSPDSKLQSISQVESPIIFTGEIIVEGRNTSIRKQKDPCKVQKWLKSAENFPDNSAKSTLNKQLKGKKIEKSIDILNGNNDVLEKFFTNLLPKTDDRTNLNEKENKKNEWSQVKKMKQTLGGEKKKLSSKKSTKKNKKTPIKSPECVVQRQLTTSNNTSIPQISTINLDTPALHGNPKSNIISTSPDSGSNDDFSHFSDATSPQHLKTIKKTISLLEAKTVPFLYKGRLQSNVPFENNDTINSTPNKQENNQGIYKWKKTSECLNLEINISSLFESEEPINKLNISLKFNDKNIETASKSITFSDKYIEKEVQTDDLHITSQKNLISPSIEKRKMDAIEFENVSNQSTSKKIKLVNNLIYNDDISVQFESQTPNERQELQVEDGALEAPIASSLQSLENDERFKMLKMSVDRYTGRIKTTPCGTNVDSNNPIEAAGGDLEEMFNYNTPEVVFEDMDFTDVVEDTPQKSSSVKVNKKTRSSSVSLGEDLSKNLTDNTLIKQSVNNINVENKRVTRLSAKKKPPQILDVAKTPKRMDTPSDINKFINNVKRHSTPLQKSAKRSLTYGSNCNKINRQTEASFTDIETDQIITIPDTPVNTKNCLEREFMEQALDASGDVKGSEKQIKDVCLMCSCLSMTEKDCLSLLVKHRGWKFVEKYDDNVTHLVINVDVANRCQRSLKYLQALAAGCWIVSLDWAKECIKTNTHVKEVAYEALNGSGENGPHLSRVSGVKIFSGMTFFCIPPFIGATDLQLNDIIRKAGGNIANSITDVEIVNPKDILILVGEPQETQEQRFYELCVKFKVVPVNIEWIMESLGKWKADNIHEWLLIERRLLPTLDWPSDLLPDDSMELSLC